MRLLDKVAVVTGGASGIGRAVATVFAREGAKVVVGDIDDAGATRTASDILARGGEALSVHADVSTEPGAENLASVAISRYSKVDILFNGVGVPGARAPIEQFDPANWDRVLATNAKSVLFTAKYIVPQMKKAGTGSIINMGSVAGVNPRANSSYAYGGSKAVVILLTKAMALDFAPFNIRVNCINPGRVDTPFNARNAPPGMTVEEFNKKAISEIPLHRLAEPEEVAYIATFLASNESVSITGISVTIDGGRTI